MSAKGKVCTKCKAWKLLDDFCANRSKKDGRQSCCKPCESAYKKEHAAKNREKIRAYKKEYGEKNRELISQRNRRNKGWPPELFDRMFELQDRRCANPACRDELTRSTAHADHCHSTGRPRAILCAPCNKALGLLRDDPSRIEGLARVAREFPPVTLLSRNYTPVKIIPKLLGESSAAPATLKSTSSPKPEAA